MLDKPSGNWVKVSREVFYHELANDKPWSRLCVWIYLIAMASTTERTVQFRGHSYSLTRGQLSISQGDLEDRAGWSRERVRSFFRYLTQKGMMAILTSRVCSVITILNYDKWQGDCQAVVGQKNNQANNHGNNQENGTLGELIGCTNNLVHNQGNNTQNKNVLQECITRIKDKDTDKIVAIARKRKKPELTPEESEVLTYLNLKADNSFTAPGEIGKRLAEGHTVEECKTIIDKKVAEWGKTEFAKNLNPTTLFRLCHFDTYLHQKGEASMKKFSVGEVGKSNMGEEWG